MPSPTLTNSTSCRRNSGVPRTSAGVRGTSWRHWPRGLRALEPRENPETRGWETSEDATWAIRPRRSPETVLGHSESSDAERPNRRAIAPDRFDGIVPRTSRHPRSSHATRRHDEPPQALCLGIMPIVDNETSMSEIIRAVPERIEKEENQAPNERGLLAVIKFRAYMPRRSSRRIRRKSANRPLGA